MKKLTVFSSIAVVALAIAGCQKPEVETIIPDGNDGSTFELYADIAQTKTTLDGYNVDWEEGDLIYMVTSDGTWGKPYAEDKDGTSIADFAYSEGKFTTLSTITESQEPYTFNAVYYNGKQRSYHRSDATSHLLSASQNQDCNTPTGHIKENDALVGTFETVIPSVEAPTVTMNHLYTMMEVDVINSTGAEIEIVEFEMTASDAVLAGTFNVTAFDVPAISVKSGASDKVTVNVTNGVLASGSSLPIYFVMAPLSDYSGDVAFKVTDSENNTYTKTVAVTNKSFGAGKYNKTNYTISECDEVIPNVTWDLSEKSYASATSNIVSWTSDYVSLSLEKGESSTAANNYLGGNNNNTHTRVYKDHILTFYPIGQYQIDKIEFEATTATYAEVLIKSVWTNGTASESGNTIEVVPLDGHNPISVQIAEATRFTSIRVYYSLDEEYVPPTLESIAVSDQKTNFIQNSTFEFGGNVIATYSDGTTKDVTAKSVFTEPNMAVSGEQIVTVSYTEGEITKSTTYSINIEEMADGTFIDVLNRDITGVTGTSYTDWNNKTCKSGAVYAGQSAGGNSSIQLRSTNSNSGIITTSSGGTVRKIVVAWNSATTEGRTLNIYGKNTAYSAVTDLYNNDSQGTLLGSIVNGTSTELEIEGDYKYIGMRSSSGAMYLGEIQITWAN